MLGLQTQSIDINKYNQQIFNEKYRWHARNEVSERVTSSHVSRNAKLEI